MPNQPLPIFDSWSLAMFMGVLLFCGCAVGVQTTPIDGETSPTTNCGGDCPSGTACSFFGECVCDPILCSGCCSPASDECLTGKSDQSCGRQGANCVDCTQVGSSCGSGFCVGCIPACQNKDCGSDGCGGNCGFCSGNTECSPLGKCECIAVCEGKCAGATDGCGGVCPTTKCRGCCDGVTCREGISDVKCGAQGSACANCAAGQESCGQGTCIDGQCVGASKPNGTMCTNGVCFDGACCEGCWDGAVCQTGESVEVCGSGGSSCLLCENEGDCTVSTCSAGKCGVSQAGVGSECTNGRCDGSGECCFGCLEENVCETGSTLEACGNGGEACKLCSNSNECVDPSCTSNGACMGINKSNGTSCLGGVCIDGTCCTGCVKAGTCYPGDEEANCGASGGECSTCVSGESCQQGECKGGGEPPTGCEAMSQGGCDGCECEDCVCAMDPFCCTFVWDSTCSNECHFCNTANGCVSSTLCGGGCGIDSGLHECQCEECVCDIDPFCCTDIIGWDAVCASYCVVECGGTCE